MGGRSEGAVDVFEKGGMKGKKKKTKQRRAFIRPYTGRMIYSGLDAADRRCLGYKQQREKTFTAFPYRIVVMLCLRAASDANPLPPEGPPSVSKMTGSLPFETT